MSSSNSQKEILTLIRDVSTEKSQGERRVVNLKRQIEELQSELESVNAELEDAKRLKECTEQDLKGCEVELAMNESSIQTLEGRIALLQGEVSTIGSDLEALKNEEWALRDDFIGKMFDLNAMIRKFHQSVDSASYEAFSSKAVLQNVHTENAHTKQVEEGKKDLERELAQIISDTEKMEHEFLLEQNLHKQEQNEVDGLKQRISLMEAVMEGSKELQAVAMQSARVEEAYNSLCDKLQKKCVCPGCACDNVEILGGVLQKSSEI
ncbi:hypothetical protein HanHA300_Chr09g0330261 [Helianthus annuus]|uniref:paramyosin n=1 Tax=Helianthus annuus TaxID=4232 RepID=UPI000B8F9417|nr:paramyosin [Helianthus annuus]XP_021983366.1 paramyosin [Helianthus annuus]XP_021983367.1 paramyosin [Helianthus annuus]XP_021983368.1 paramyosin [Helianthus annuus]KAJ0527084.1 hypothetical protein HanHA300_Chr09g0330261 [Helianthus annuus]KAJ0535700.1 hypothetical protein HanIR_Chr09g0433491 [Helianthus annuus]KAJ0543483.1 hypothetical protein HanHA89_Chr09g0351201 [Helianthus annuus]KAJ0708535.1 hypothetical protein HanLR1_Chr09g0330491 [Helianthus annuus]